MKEFRNPLLNEFIAYMQAADCRIVVVYGYDDMEKFSADSDPQAVAMAISALEGCSVRFIHKDGGKASAYILPYEGNDFLCDYGLNETIPSKRMDAWLELR